MSLFDENSDLFAYHSELKNTTLCNYNEIKYIYKSSNFITNFGRLSCTAASRVDLVKNIFCNNFRKFDNISRQPSIWCYIENGINNIFFSI